MTATYIATAAGNHGIDYVTDSGKKGFVIGILDERTARTLAAGPELLEALQEALDQLESWNIESEDTFTIKRVREAINKATQP
jgi:hypothetical protein